MPIEVDSQAIWCSRHRKALELDPRRRFDVACMRLFDYTVRDPRIKMEAGYNPETGAKADADRLTDLVKAHSPLCCYLPGPIFERVLVESYPNTYKGAVTRMLREDAEEARSQ